VDRILEDIVNPRRLPRAQVRCDVEIRHRLTAWSGETEDLSVGGCQIVTARVIDPGREVKLAIRSPAIPRTLLVSGRVAWTRPSSPARLGVAFTSGAPDAWFAAVLRAGAVRVSAAPQRVPRMSLVHLGRAPEVVVDFTRDELDLLRRVGGGVTVDVLVRSYGEDLPDRARAAFFSLLARRSLVLDPGAAGSAEAWRRVLERRDREAPAAARPVRAAGPAGRGRTPEVQRLYDEALAHIGSGRLTLAMDRLNAALEVAPDDPLISSTARRIARWA
jgi:Tfp pilus assembly protein PilZ